MEGKSLKEPLELGCFEVKKQTESLWSVSSCGSRRPPCSPGGFQLLVFSPRASCTLRESRGGWPQAAEALRAAPSPREPAGPCARALDVKQGADVSSGVLQP